MAIKNVNDPTYNRIYDPTLTGISNMDQLMLKNRISNNNNIPQSDTAFFSPYPKNYMFLPEDITNVIDLSDPASLIKIYNEIVREKLSPKSVVNIKEYYELGSFIFSSIRKDSDTGNLFIFNGDVISFAKNNKLILKMLPNTYNIEDTNPDKKIYIFEDKLKSKFFNEIISSLVKIYYDKETQDSYRSIMSSFLYGAYGASIPKEGEKDQAMQSYNYNTSKKATYLPYACMPANTNTFQSTCLDKGGYISRLSGGGISVCNLSTSGRILRYKSFLLANAQLNEKIFKESDKKLKFIDINDFFKSDMYNNALMVCFGEFHDRVEHDLILMRELQLILEGKKSELFKTGEANAIDTVILETVFSFMNTNLLDQFVADVSLPKNKDKVLNALNNYNNSAATLFEKLDRIGVIPKDKKFRQNLLSNLEQNLEGVGALEIRKIMLFALNGIKIRGFVSEEVATKSREIIIEEKQFADKDNLQHWMKDWIKRNSGNYKTHQELKRAITAAYDKERMLLNEKKLHTFINVIKPGLNNQLKEEIEKCKNNKVMIVCGASHNDLRSEIGVGRSFPDSNIRIDFLSLDEFSNILNRSYHPEYKHIIKDIDTYIRNSGKPLSSFYNKAIIVKNSRYNNDSSDVIILTE